jgi:predicted DNA-binding transcriptional regulator YafY
VRRGERLVKLVELLHATPGADAESLARSCGVSERTLQRDLDALSAAGLPVFFDQGYRLAAPALIPPLRLTVDEALSLHLAAQAAIPRAEAAAAHSLEIAARKLQLALSAKPEEPDPSRQLALELPPVPDARLEACLAVLADAIGQRRTVKLSFREGRQSSQGARQVDPYQLLPSGTGWELLAYCHDRRRLLRIPLARLVDVAVLRRKFATISDRLLARHLHRDGAAVSIRWMRLLCRPPLAQSLLKQPPVGALLWEDGPEGSVIFTVGTSDPEELLPWLLACGDAVEVLQPTEVRQRLRRIAETVARRHAPADALTGKAPSGPHRKVAAGEDEPATPGDASSHEGS